jgi:uncharacterized protein YqeY
MTLSEQISKEIIQAMKAKEKVTLEALRAVKTAFTIARTSKGANAVLSDDEELKIMQKLVKQRKDSALIYKEQGRTDLFEKEISEVTVLEKYLPAKLSDDELLSAVQAIINKTGATSMKEMGKVMGIASKELAGKADGKEISAKVKEILG